MAGFVEKPRRAEGLQYTQKEKMHFFAEQSKVGATNANGEERSDFERGRNFGRSEEIGNNLGRYKYAQADEQGKAEIRAKGAEIKAKKAADRAMYLASQAKQVGNKKGK